MKEFICWFKGHKMYREKPSKVNGNVIYERLDSWAIQIGDETLYGAYSKSDLEDALKVKSHKGYIKRW